jgi:PPOX class probable F420-dependent enzyme
MLAAKAHTRGRLLQDRVAWLTTVSHAGIPSTAPVWFIVEPDDTILVYSRDPSVRVRNVRQNPAVTFALNSDPMGNDIVVINGTAVLDAEAPTPDRHRAFIDKYRPTLEDYEWTPEWFAKNYPTALRITITSIRGR